MYLKDHLLMKVNRHLGVVWEKHYGNYYGDSSMTDNGAFIRQQDDGSFLLAGYFQVPGWYRDLALIEVDHNGACNWHASWEMVGNDFGQCVLPLTGGDLLVVGSANSRSPYAMEPGSGARPCAVRCRPQGPGAGEYRSRQFPGLGSVPAIIRGVLNLQSAIYNLQSEIALLDVSGRRILDLKPGANDVSRLAPGVYFVHAQGARAQATCRLVKE